MRSYRKVPFMTHIYDLSDVARYKPVSIGDSNKVFRMRFCVRHLLNANHSFCLPNTFRQTEAPSETPAKPPEKKEQNHAEIQTCLRLVCLLTSTCRTIDSFVHFISWSASWET